MLSGGGSGYGPRTVLIHGEAKNSCFRGTSIVGADKLKVIFSLQEEDLIFSVATSSDLIAHYIVGMIWFSQLLDLVCHSHPDLIIFIHHSYVVLPFPMVAQHVQASQAARLWWKNMLIRMVFERSIFQSGYIPSERPRYGCSSLLLESMPFLTRLTARDNVVAVVLCHRRVVLRYSRNPVLETSDRVDKMLSTWYITTNRISISNRFRILDAIDLPLSLAGIPPACHLYRTINTVRKWTSTDRTWWMVTWSSGQTNNTFVTGDKEGCVDLKRRALWGICDVRATPEWLNGAITGVVLCDWHSIVLLIYLRYGLIICHASYCSEVLWLEFSEEAVLDWKF